MKQTLINDCLSKCFEKGKMVSLYCDIDNPETHLTGYIDTYNDYEILIRHISAAGNYDGFILIRSEDLHRIDFDGQYENKIEILYRFKQQSHPSLITTNALWKDLCRFTQENHLVANFELSSDFVLGFIDCFTDDLVQVRVVNKYGTPEGTSVIQYCDIVSIAVDTIEEQNVKILFSQKEKGSK